MIASGTIGVPAVYAQESHLCCYMTLAVNATSDAYVY
jgi:hypothetical protein